MSFGLIVTVSSIERVHYLLDNGCKPDYFRLNLSHCTVDQAVEFLREYANICGDIPIFLDLQGSKIRLLREQPVVVLSSGQDVVVASAPIADHTCILIDKQVLQMCCEACSKHEITALIDDGKVELRLATGCSPSAESSLYALVIVHPSFSLLVRLNTRAIASRKAHNVTGPLFPVYSFGP